MLIRPNIRRQRDAETSTHVKKESSSTIKYAAVGTPTKQNSHKQGCRVVVAGVACFRAGSEYLLLDLMKWNFEVELTRGS